MAYIEKIITGFMIFPWVAVVFTLPYALYQYHKYGSVSKFRTLVIYSFILYMLVAYFQIILPLPPLESTIGNRWQDHLNLIPFMQIWLYWHDKSFTISEIIAYAKSFSLWQLLLNILLTMPFGVYLRYYFKQDLKHTIFYTFLLSLFYELTQLSALYGIYPGPYRLADVEDLICNTLGGAWGYYVASVFALVLPKRDEIDAQCRKAGKVITGKRRFWAVLFDFVCSEIIYLFIPGVILILFPSATWADLSRWMYDWSFFYIFSAIQVLITGGWTAGHAACRMKLVSKDGEPATRLQIILRYFYVWLFTDFPLIVAVNAPGRHLSSVYDLFLLTLMLLSRLYFVYYFVNEVIRSGAREMPHDKLSKTAYMATEIPEENTIDLDAASGL